MLADSNSDDEAYYSEAGKGKQPVLMLVIFVSTGCNQMQKWLYHVAYQNLFICTVCRVITNSNSAFDRNIVIFYTEWHI